MAHRGTESPMDFEWQSHGPTDPNSPFHKLAMENQRKRNHAALESPPKSSFRKLREPNGQPFLFNSIPLPAESSPFRSPSFTTPRKPTDFDFSSGPESSPAGPGDFEETPDGKPLPPLPADFKSSKAKRNSLFGLYGRFAPSPGRGEIRKPHDGVVKKVMKKRRKAQTFERQLTFERASGDDTSDGDDDDARLESDKSHMYPPKPHDVGWMTGLFTFIHTYPDAPSIIAKYLQVFFNAAILFGCLYMFWSFYATIRADVDRASEEAVQDILSEMAKCSNDYVQNMCGKEGRPPALEAPCNAWALCANRDPNAIKRARLSAHTFAEIFNSFIEPISLKTMIFTVTFVALGLIINNVTFTMYRHSQQPQFSDVHRQYPGNWAPPGHSDMNHIPSTPGQHAYQQPLGWHEQTPSRHQHQIEYRKSPTKEYGRSRSRSPEKKMLKIRND